MNAPLHRELPATVLDSATALSQVSRQWDSDLVRQLTDYIAIPAKSPGFDPDWAQHGFIETVLRNAAAWVEAQKVPGLQLEVVRLPGRTPVLFFEVAATKPGAQQTGADVRPSRQAARVHGLALRPRSLDPQVRGRQAVRPRWRRRRLCGVCQHRRGAGAEGAERAAPAHRRA
jgi:hypothetical protein